MSEQNFLARIRAAEQAAEDQLSLAAEQGRLALAKAQEQAAAQIEAARREAENLVSESVLQAEAQARQIQADALSLSARQAEMIRSSAGERLPVAIQAVMERIVSDSAGR